MGQRWEDVEGRGVETREPREGSGDTEGKSKSLGTLGQEWEWGERQRGWGWGKRPGHKSEREE